MPVIHANGINLYYEIHGVGEVVVLVAGYAVDHFVWSIVVKELAKKYQVVVFDNRGTGQSDCPDAPYSIELFADDAVALCKALNIEKAHFIGNSMGGRIVQAIAYYHPQIVSKVVISNAPSKPSERFMLVARAQLAFSEAGMSGKTILMNALPWLYSTQFLAKPNMIENLLLLGTSAAYPTSSVGLRRQLEAVANFDSSKWINAISAPCLVLGGDDDLIVPLPLLEEMAKSISHAKFYCFKDVGHLPFIEQPDQFCEVISDFLESTK